MKSIYIDTATQFVGQVDVETTADIDVYLRSSTFRTKHCAFNGIPVMVYVPDGIAFMPAEKVGDAFTLAFLPDVVIFNSALLFTNDGTNHCSDCTVSAVEIAEHLRILTEEERTKVYDKILNPEVPF